MNRIDETRAFIPIRIAILTVSDTRALDTDKSGQVLADRVVAAGHQLAARKIVRDDIKAIRAVMRDWLGRADVDAVISTGGTGLTGRDVTPEALERVRQARGGRDIPGFGELFRWVSYKTIGTSTIRARPSPSMWVRSAISARRAAASARPGCRAGVGYRAAGL